MLKRIRTADTNGQVGATRGILHGAMALYLTRYLNVPPARIPGEHDEQLDELPGDAAVVKPRANSCWKAGHEYPKKAGCLVVHQKAARART